MKTLILSVLISLTQSVMGASEPGKYIHVDTDPGWDPDDKTAALFLAAKMVPLGYEVAVSTTLYNPDEKAAIASFFMPEGTPISSGFGSYQCIDEHRSFLEKYAAWPLAFGDPAIPYDPEAEFTNYKCIYPFQLESWNRHFGEKIVAERISRFRPENLSDLLDFYVKKPNNSITITSLAPTQNIGILLNTPGMKEKIKNFVLMGGWFGSIDVPGRLGYNTVNSLESTQAIIDSGLPVLFVTSALCQKYSIDIQKFIALRSQESSPVAMALRDAAINWEIHRARKTQKPAPEKPEDLKLGNPILADVLTMYLALHPEAVDETEGVKFVLHPKKVLENIDDRIHMLHPKAPTLFTVERDESSNVRIVKSIKKEQQVVDFITNIFFEFYSNQQQNMMEF